jgi:cell division protein FtsQ
VGGLYLLWRVGEVALDAFVYDNADFAIQQVDVQTTGEIAPDQLRRWAGVKPGANLIGLDLAAVKRNLELQPLIASVSVERVLPRTLKIRVTERQPIAQVNVPRADGADGVAVAVFQLDADGMVMLPLDPRMCVVPLEQVNSELPVITGMNAFQLRVGRRVELPVVQAALQLLVAFDQSPMAGLVDLRRVDVSGTGVLVVTTGQGGEITFRLDHLDQQLRRWRKIYDYALSRQSTIVSADLAVANNVPVRLALASTAPAPVAPKSVKPLKNRKKNV